MPYPGKRYAINLPVYLADCECNYRRLRRLIKKTQINRFFGELLEFFLIEGRVTHKVVTIDHHNALVEL